MRIIHVTARIFTYEHNLAVVQAILAMDESMRKWMESRAIPLAFEQQGLADVLHQPPPNPNPVDDTFDEHEAKYVMAIMTR